MVFLTDQPDLWGWVDEVGATEPEKFIVWLLKSATSARPIGISVIQSRLKGELHTVMSDRSIKDFIRTLRREHKMPVLARRGKPSGYFWCGDLDEMRSFIHTFRQQAEDEMDTVRRIVAEHYPSLAQELEMRGEES